MFLLLNMFENIFYQKGFTHSLSLGIVSMVTILGTFVMNTKPKKPQTVDYSEKDSW